MHAPRCLFVATAMLLWEQDLLAQSRADFDALAEGTSATTLVTPAGTFQDLVLDAAGTPGMFFVDDASASLPTYASRFSPPNVLAPGGFVAGPTLASTPVKSFRILLSQPASAIRVGVFVDTLPQANGVDVQFVSAGQVLFQSHIVPFVQSGWHADTVSACDHPGGPFDELRFVGQGSVDGGRFRCAIDTLVIANAPCGSAVSACAANVVGGCPCGKPPFPGPTGGCGHSAWGGLGGRLGASGISSLTVDEVLLNVVVLPRFATGILAQSTAITNGVVFGDGVLCLSPPRIRVLGMTMNDAGYQAYPWPWELPLSVRAGLTTPGARWYQFVFRDVASFCTPSTYNVTNGISIAWVP
jgi:hypothetical protein